MDRNCLCGSSPLDTTVWQKFPPAIWDQFKKIRALGYTMSSVQPLFGNPGIATAGDIPGSLTPLMEGRQHCQSEPPVNPRGSARYGSRLHSLFYEWGKSDPMPMGQSEEDLCKVTLIDTLPKSLLLWVFPRRDCLGHSMKNCSCKTGVSMQHE